MAGFPNKLKRLVSKKNAKKDDNAGEPIDTKPAQTAGGKEVETLKSVKTGGSGSTAASTSNKNNAATAAAAAAATVKPTKSTVSAAAAHRGKDAGSGKPVQLKSSKMAKPAPLKTSKTQSSQGALQKTPSATEKKISTQKRSPQPPAMRKSLTDGAEGRGSENNAKMKSSANGPGGRGSTENLAKASEKGSVVKLAAKDKTEEESIQELDGIIKELSITADIAVPTSSDHDDGVSEFSGGSAKSLESESEEEGTDQEEEEEESIAAGIEAAENRLSNTGGDAKLVTKEVPIPPRTPTFQSELSAKTEKIGNEIDDNAQGELGKVANESVKGSVATSTTAAKQSAKKSIKSNASKETSKASGLKARGTGGKEGPTCDFTNGSAPKGSSLNQNAKNITRHVDRGNGTTSMAAAKTNAELASPGGITSKRTISRNGVGTKLTGGYIKGKKNNDPKANVSRSVGTSTLENSAEKENVDALPSSTLNDTQTVDDAKPVEEKTSGAGPTIVTVTKKKSLFSKAFKTNKSGSAKKFPDASTSEVKTEPSVITTSPNGGVTTEKQSHANGDTTGKKSPSTGVTHEAEDVVAESCTTGVPPASDIKPKTSKAEVQSSETKSRSKEHEFPSAVAPARAGNGSRKSHDVRPHPTSSGRNLYQSRDDKDDTSEEDREEYSQYNDGESIEMQRQLSGDISLYTKSTFGETMTFETHLDDIDEDDNDTMEDTEAIRHTDVIIHEPGEPSDLLMRVLYWKPQLEYGNDVIIQVEASTVSFRDCLLRRDIGPDRAKFPLVPGCEVVGTISLLNSNAKKRGYRVGDRVVAMSRNGGGNATFASFPVSCIAPISKNVDASEAVCLVDVYMTAHQALRLSKKQATPLTGSNVLITDGFTPVGQACVQLALMEGANVYVTAMESTQDSYLKSIGAKCLPFEPMEWLPKIQGRMDVVIDNTCFDSYDSSWKALNPNGILVCTGMTSLYSVLDHESELYGCDAFGNMTVKIQAMWAETKAKYIMSRTMFHDVYANMQNDPKVYQQELKYLCFMLEKGRIKPKIDSTVGIEDVSDCHRRIEAGKANGTIVCLP